MKNSLFVVLSLCFMSYLFSCKTVTPSSYVKSVDTLSSDQLAAKGILEKQGMTFYQYGTHVLKDTAGIPFYALTSDSINMDAFIDRVVTIIATKIEGYPVSGGPVYLKVIRINE